jgi:hypothetical protein
MFKGVGYRKQAKGLKNAVEYAALKKDMPLVVYINSEEGTRELGKYLNKHIQFTQQCQVAPAFYVLMAYFLWDTMVEMFLDKPSSTPYKNKTCESFRQFRIDKGL